MDPVRRRGIQKIAVGVGIILVIIVATLAIAPIYYR